MGVDVGGTKCLGVVLDEAGSVVRSVVHPTPARFDELADTVAAVLDELDPGGCAPVGVGLPGLVDREGRLHAAPHLDEGDDPNPLEAAAVLRARLGRVVRLDNDASLAALAEWQLGGGRGLSNLVLVTLGSGIGGGVISGGRLLRGEHGFVGEFGHMMIDPAGPACVCGKRGCWERYASGQGLSVLAQAAAARGELESVVAATGRVRADVDGEVVEAAARGGDASAVAVLDEFARWTGIGLAGLTNAFDPAAFVLGGGLARMSDLLAEPIERWLRESLYAAWRRPMPGVRFAELGPEAGAIGAALLSREEVPGT